MRLQGSEVLQSARQCDIKIDGILKANWGQEGWFMGKLQAARSEGACRRTVPGPAPGWLSSQKPGWCRKQLLGVAGALSLWVGGSPPSLSPQASVDAAPGGPLQRAMAQTPVPRGLLSLYHLLQRRICGRNFCGQAALHPDRDHRQRCSSAGGQHRLKPGPHYHPITQGNPQLS